MRLLFILCIAIAVTTACKLEASSNTSNANANANSSPPTVATTSSDQESGSKCSLTLAAAPSIAGLRLGMTSDQILALFPGSKDDPNIKRYLNRPRDQFGDEELVVRPPDYLKKGEPVRFKHINFNLLDGKVYSFNISFNGPVYSHVDKFVEALSPEMNFPPLNQWEPYVGMDNQLKILNCGEFEVRVFAGGPGGSLNYVLVKDALAEKKLDKRRAKANPQATPAL